jgi:mRNA-degrading endonuclease toxin of MazEF toxin-antitoxin module
MLAEVGAGATTLVGDAVTSSVTITTTWDGSAGAGADAEAEAETDTLEAEGVALADELREALEDDALGKTPANAAASAAALAAVLAAALLP